MTTEHTTIPQGKMVAIDLEGMHCTSCASLIEHSLKDVPGVQNASVNYSSSQAMVKLDHTQIDEQALLQVVKDAGYSGSIVDQQHTISETEKRNKETHHRWNKFKRAAILSIPMVAFMFYDFFPSFIPGEKIIMPRTAIISLILTAPILFIIGGDFFKGARSALKMKTFNMYSLIAIGTGVAFFYSLYNMFLFLYQTGTMVGLDGMKIPNIYFEVA